ncbi:hypothetical protein D3C81_1124840 [compost metagenome]
MRKFKLVLMNDDEEFMLYDEKDEVIMESDDQRFRINQAIDVFESTLKYLGIEYEIDIVRE